MWHRVSTRFFGFNSQSMNILLVGWKSRDSWSEIFGMLFEKKGHHVAYFDDWREYYKVSPFTHNKIISRLCWPLLSLPVQEEFVHTALERKPDIIFFFKGWLIRPETIKRIKRILPRTLFFNYNPDSPFNTWHFGNSNSWIRKSIPLFDCYFMWDASLEKPLKEMGAQRFEYLPCAYDPEIHYPMDPADADERVFYGSDLAFVGTWDEERERWLKSLLEYDLKIWGNSWEKACRSVQKKWMRQPAVGADYAKVCSSSKILLNILRKQNANSHNQKFFELAAYKGFPLFFISM